MQATQEVVSRLPQTTPEEFNAAVQVCPLVRSRFCRYVALCAAGACYAALPVWLCVRQWGTKPSLPATAEPALVHPSNSVYPLTLLCPLQAAKDAFPKWRNTPVSTRARVMLKLQQLINEHMVGGCLDEVGVA